MSSEKTIHIKLEEFGTWLRENYLPAFKKLENIQDFLSQGLSFLFASGSIFLRNYILKEADEYGLLPSKYEGRVSDRAYLWNMFSQLIVEIHIEPEVLKLILREQANFKMCATNE
ncbi:MAG: hypothetical protein ACFE7E_03875 [Candidatus Hodarchaeota archaeon]